MNQSSSPLKRVFSALWNTLNFTRKAIINLFFFGILVLIIVAATSDEGKVHISDSSALVLNLNGDLVEQKRALDPMQVLEKEMYGNQEPPEVLLSDIILVLDNAKHDNRIKSVVLLLEDLGNASMNKLQDIGAKLEEIKAVGKPIYAVGNFYLQHQYFLASYADHIILDPYGGIALDGYGRYQAYFKSALEKLKISTHVFRVGTYKSAVEPYIRDDMSKEAKEANQAWIETLWTMYKTDVAERRALTIDDFDESLDELTKKIEAADNDFAQYALNNGWVDKLATRNDMRTTIAEVVGWDESKTSFSQIDFNAYLSLIKMPFVPAIVHPNQVAVIVAKGTILDGHQKAGTIGGDSTANLLQDARLDDNVKAVVLRIDSPGGSAFASEVINREIELLKAAGKPVVASMSSVAASGGYWIAASADQIWAAPSTITGSIGIFGMFMTFENTLEYLGIHTDGVATTDMSGFSVARPLDEKMANIIQISVNKGYQRFIDLVSKNRGMSPEAVDKVAQGRVWTGLQAQQLGLVDELGNLKQAVAAAAELAELTDYKQTLIEHTLTPQEQLIQQIIGQSAKLGLNASTFNSSNDNALLKVIQTVKNEFDGIASLNDPNGAYVLCLECR